MPPDLLRGTMERERIGDDLRCPQLLKRASTVSTPTHGALSSLWVRRIDRGKFLKPRMRSSQGPPISAAVHESSSMQRFRQVTELLTPSDRAASTRAFDPEKTLARPSKVATQQLRRRIDKETGLLCVSAQLF